MEQNQGQLQNPSKAKMNGNKGATTAMEMTPEGIQSYIQDTIKELIASLSDATGTIKQYTQATYDDSVEYVKKNPGKAVLGGVGLGFLIGAAFTAILSRKH